MDTVDRARARLGRRVQVVGNTGAGKSMLASMLARTLDAPHVELDALNWLPGWVGLHSSDPEVLRARIRAATAGDAWVVDGSYHTFASELIWPRLCTLVWLDLPLSVLLRRVVARSWRRHRAGELLWGTNREAFWDQLKVWRGEQSLLWCVVAQHEQKRRCVLDVLADPAWAHLRVVRLQSEAEVGAFIRGLDGRR